MKRFKMLQVCLVFMMLILSGLLITGCGKSDELAQAVGLVDNVLPGTCSEAGPKVLSSDPTDNTENVSINADISVLFDEIMDPTTIEVTNSGDPEVLTFTLRDNNDIANTEGTVAMSVLNTVATFTPDEALHGDSWYTATITRYARNAGGTSLGCSYQWEFKTVATP
jgi:methionine-rich copper-binding protein CopC